MEWDAKDLPQDRPSSFDQSGKRLFLQPGEVDGRYRRLRSIVYWILIFVFLVVPWTEYEGHQSILLNIGERKFIFFGLTFWAHDAPLIFFPLIISALILTFITAIWGRLWCGWACPQTVFIDILFRQIERITEGTYLKRIKLNKQPWGKVKIFKKTVKWVLYTLVSLHIAHSFVAYFVGARALVWVSLNSPSENWVTFLIVQSLAVVLLFNFAWFREQFCIIMCPYGRFQSVLMGRNSLSVLYDEKRGEPRKQAGVKDGGDCVNCYRCVNVCPTGIDIRNGVQMECIACTACIDACDDIMTKIKKPTGLIKYASENEIRGEKRKIITPRSVTYFVLIAVLTAVFVSLVYLRPPLDFVLLRAIDSPYTVVPSNKGEVVINHFRLHVSNHGQGKFDIESLVSQDKSFEIVAPALPMQLKPGKQGWVHFFVKRSRSLPLPASAAATRLFVHFRGEKIGMEEITISFLGPQ